MAILENIDTAFLQLAITELPRAGEMMLPLKATETDTKNATLALHCSIKWKLYLYNYRGTKHSIFPGPTINLFDKVKKVFLSQNLICLLIILLRGQHSINIILMSLIYILVYINRNSSRI